MGGMISVVGYWMVREKSVTISFIRIDISSRKGMVKNIHDEYDFDDGWKNNNKTINLGSWVRCG